MGNKEFPKWNPKGKSRSFNAFEPMDILHPEENGGSKADFTEQVLDPTALYFRLIVKGPHEMSL